MTLPIGTAKRQGTNFTNLFFSRGIFFHPARREHFLKGNAFITGDAPDRDQATAERGLLLSPFGVTTPLPSFLKLVF